MLSGAIILILASGIPAQVPEADTIARSRIVAIRDTPVIKATEEAAISLLPVTPLTIADAVRSFTGVQVKDYGGLGGLKTINVRSLGSEHVGVFIDGIQVDNAQNMQVDLGRFGTESFRSVSLYSSLKGMRLQSAKEYAAGASLHLDGDNTPEGLLLGFKGGSFDTYNPRIGWGGKIGPLKISASADFLTSGGRYPYPYFDTTLVRENGDIRSLRLETRLAGNLPRGQWDLRLYGYGAERGFPGPVVRRASGFPLSAERQADEDIFVQGSWTNEWSARYGTAIRFKYANYYTHYNTHPEQNPMAMPWDLHYRQQSAYLSAAQSYLIGGPWQADFATDLQYNVLDTDVAKVDRPERTSFTGALAVKGVWEKVRAGAHIVYLGAWDNTLFRSAWMPSLSLSWMPFEGLEADAFIKSTYRLPSFNDLYYTLIGNSGLLPERAFQCGANVRFTRRVGGWIFDGRVSPYYNRVTDKIVAVPTASQFRWSMLNIGIVDILGTDVKAGLAGRYMEVALRYSFPQALDHSRPGSPTWGGQIPYIPLHSGSVDLRAWYGDWTFGWSTSWSGEKYSRSANIPDYRIEPWCVSDASIGLKLGRQRTTDLLPQGSRPLKLSLTVQNVFNHRYQIVQGYPMPGTSLLLSCSWEIDCAGLANGLQK